LKDERICAMLGLDLHEGRVGFQRDRNHRSQYANATEPWH
jgi:hypothetical protein